MIMKLRIAQRVSLAALAALLAACSGNGTDPQPTGPYTNGVFVINEGNFTDNNGTLSWLSRTNSTGTPDRAENDVFRVRNNRLLTGGVSGYIEAGNRGIILVDHQTAGLDKVEIVTSDLLQSVKTLAAPDIENPRDAARISDTKVYVTCWGTTGSSPFYVNPGYVAVIDLTTNTVTKKIPVQKGAEGVTVVGTEAFITGVGGENIVQVIDTQTDAVTQQIAVTAGGDKLLRDANNKLWILAGTNAVRINPSTKTVEATIPIGSASGISSSDKLAVSADGRTFYYRYTIYDAQYNVSSRQVFRFGNNDPTINPTTPVINRTFAGFGVTGLGVDPQSNAIYLGVTPSYKQAGFVYRYQPTGQLIDSSRVEIAPSKFYFK